MFADWDEKTRSTRRFTCALVTAVILGAVLNFSLAYMIPVLLVKFLIDKQQPGWHTLLELMLALLGLLAIALLFSRGLTQYPFPALITIALIMFWGYLWLSDPRWSFLATLILIGVVVIPFVGEGSAQVSWWVAVNLVFAAALALLLFTCAHILLPAKQILQPIPVAEERNSEAIKDSLRALVIAFPVVVYFYFVEPASNILIMILVVVLSMQISLDKSAKLGVFLLATNVLGGIAAFVLYLIWSVQPTLWMYIALIGVSGFVAAHKIFSGDLRAPIFAGIFSTMLVLLQSATRTLDADLAANFYQRLLLLLAVVMYMIVAAAVMDILIKKQAQRYVQTQR